MKLIARLVLLSFRALAHVGATENLVGGELNDADSTPPLCVERYARPFDAGHGGCETYAEDYGDGGNFDSCSKHYIMFWGYKYAKEFCSECGECSTPATTTMPTTTTTVPTTTTTMPSAGTIFGSIYFNPDWGVGLGSFHFNTADDSYVSYEKATQWPSELERTLEFESAAYDEATRTFTGTVTWPLNPLSVDEYSMIFSKDFSTISGGHWKIFDAEGKETGESYSFGTDLVYEKLGVKGDNEMDLV